MRACVPACLLCRSGAHDADGAADGGGGGGGGGGVTGVVMAGVAPVIRTSSSQLVVWKHALQQ